MALPAQMIPAPTPGPEVTGTLGRLEAWSKALVVRTAEQYNAAISTLQSVKACRKQVTEFFGPMKQAAHKAWRGVCDKEGEFTKRLDAIEATAKRACLAYQQEQERIRLEEQRRLQAEADERARKEQERLMARAAKAEEKGKEGKAEALREQAAMVSAPVVEVSSMQPKVAGVATKTIWKARVVDVNLVPREYMVPNMDALNAIAKSTKGSIAIPGVEFYSEQSLAIGGRS